MEPTQPNAQASPDATIVADQTDTTDKSVTDDDSIVAFLKARVDATVRKRRTMSSEWKHSVDLRMGRPMSGLTTTDLEDDYQSELNPDWSLTKTKVANLYSQVPTVQATHENKQYGPAISPFARSLNYELGTKRTNVGISINEVLNDVVNAAGVGAVEVGYAARTEMKSVPLEEVIQLPPSETNPQGMQIPVKQIPEDKWPLLVQKGLLHMHQVEQVISDKFFIERFSPTDFVWPDGFTGSLFDDADFTGRDGKMSTSDATNEYRLTPEQVAQASGGGNPDSRDTLQTERDRDRDANDKTIRYTKIYYWRHRVDPNEKQFKAIWECVWVRGIEKPVRHEPWKGQQLDPVAKKFVGAVKFPIRVLTLTYISDNPIPPSDSKAGRPQVNDMRRSRSQMFENREHSKPIRWFDTNRVDPEVRDLLAKGVVQGMIPTNGAGDKVIGEIARASYPSEDLAFDQAAQADLWQSWHLGPNQNGVPVGGRQTAEAAGIMQQNFATVIGKERADTATFFLGICDVLAGLMVLHSDFPILTDQERQAMEQAWDSKHILHDLVFKLRPDSTILLEAGARLEKLSTFLNLTVKSGYVNPVPILTEMAELSGLDPADVIIQPTPQGPPDPNVSYRFSGKEDLNNISVMAMLVKHKQAPSPQDMAEAKKILLDAQVLAISPADAPTSAGAAGASGAAVPPGEPDAPAGNQEPPSPGGPDAHPDWQLGSRVAKRERDANG